MKTMLLVSEFSLSYLAISVNTQFAKLVIKQIPRVIFEEYGTLNYNIDFNIVIIIVAIIK